MVWAQWTALVLNMLAITGYTILVIGLPSRRHDEIIKALQGLSRTVIGAGLMYFAGAFSHILP